MFIASKDNNTGVVYKWSKIDSDGNTESYYVPESDWKLEKDWSVSEVERLFATAQVVAEAPVDEAPEEISLNLSRNSEIEF